MNLTEQGLAKACCADLYQSDLARLVFGDSLHPGGLALTNRLARLMDLRPDDWVVDLASGRGSSALAVSRVFHCNVVGVEFGAAAVAQARISSLEPPPAPRAMFLRGDAECPPLRPGSLDAVFCECSMSLFMDKSAAVRGIARLLRPGGKFGLSDVTVMAGSLPAELGGTVGQLLCLSDALDTQGYLGLLQSAGLQVVHQQDASSEVLKILDGVESKLGALQAWQGLVQQAGDKPDILEKAPQLIAKLRQMVDSGSLGYWLFVAEKPS